jgi:hypothetical protein
MVSSGLLRRVALVRTDVSEEPGTSFIRVTGIGELGTAQAETSNRRTLRRILRRRQVPPKRRFLQEPHGVTTQKTPFFIVTAVKTSNLIMVLLFCIEVFLFYYRRNSRILCSIEYAYDTEIWPCLFLDIF